MKNQLAYVVRDSEAYGQSKHADKSNENGVRHDGRTYSYTSMNSKLDTAKQFGKWMQENHSEVRYARDIKSDHINEWLQRKSESCAKATLETYTSNLRSLVKQISNTYNVAPICQIRDIITPITQKDPIRTRAFSDSDLERLQASFRKDSLGYNALCLERATGCRVEGLSKLTTEDIKIINENQAVVRVHGEKGGRERLVDVRGYEHIKNLEHIKEIIPAGQRICPIKPDSINANFRRHMNELGMRYDKTTTHAMRKNWAQNTYNEYRKTHTKWETVRYVNEQLGHSAERDEELLGRYVADMH